MCTVTGVLLKESFSEEQRRPSLDLLILNTFLISFLTISLQLLLKTKVYNCEKARKTISNLSF